VALPACVAISGRDGLVSTPDPRKQRQTISLKFARERTDGFQRITSNTNCVHSRLFAAQ